MVRETMFTTTLVAALATAGLAHADPQPTEKAAAPAAVSPEEDDDEADAAPAAPSGRSAPSAGASPTEGAPSPAGATPEAEAADDDDDDDTANARPSKLKTEWNGRIQTDLRFRPMDVGMTPWYDGRGFKAGVERNQNLLVGTLKGSYGRVDFKADVNLFLYGYTRDVYEFADLTRREKIDPYRLDIQNLYFEVENLFVKDFDLRVGQQLVDWGVGDQFNPTNNLNSDDVEDVLLFGKQQGNFMVKGTYWLNEDWSHEAVLVPVFKPAVLPRSAVLGLSRVDRIPVLNDALRWRLMSENAAAMNNPLDTRNATVVTSATPELPDMSFNSMQFGYRIGGTIYDQDVSLSYYRGRFDFPVPYKNVVRQDRTRRCNPENPADCIDSTLQTDVRLMFPEMQVYGLNVAGEIGLLKKLSQKLFHSIGYRLEAALIVPQKTTFAIDRGAVTLSGGGQTIEIPAGEYDYDGDGSPGGELPLVTDGRAFAKWTLGLDYTFNEHFYLNTQWVHGMPDEFGAGDFLQDGYTVGASYVDVDTTTLVGCAFGGNGERCAREFLRPRIADYLVLGLDYRAMQQKLLIRLFTVLALNGIRETYFDPNADARVAAHHSMFTEKGFSAVLYPSVTYNFGNGLEMSAGALAQVGREWTKFGDAATGGTILWTRANLAF
ncbi:MAG: hypothetical protein FJ095_14070 [Deltaproteobacteria bacterium]|nr:hypothetical protein [Deltaproteobacteria bacterium]